MGGQMSQHAGIELEEISYNMLIHAYARAGELKKAESWMHRMSEGGLTPNTISYSSVINACARVDDVASAEKWFYQMEKVGKNTPNSVAFNSMIHVCAKARDFIKAEKWMNKMEDAGIPRDRITFNAILNCCARAGEEKKAEEWFNRMKQEGLEPDEISYNSVINACASNVYKAEQWFQEMVNRNLPIEIITINMISRANANAGNYRRVEDLMLMAKKMGMQPNEHCFSSLFGAYANAVPKQKMPAEAVFKEFMDHGLKVNRPLLINLKRAVGLGRLLQLCADYGMPENTITKLLNEKPMPNRQSPGSLAIPYMR